VFKCLVRLLLIVREELEEEDRQRERGEAVVGYGEWGVGGWGGEDEVGRDAEEEENNVLDGC
jgi:hypothetical protein